MKIAGRDTLVVSTQALESHDTGIDVLMPRKLFPSQMVTGTHGIIARLRDQASSQDSDRCKNPHRIVAAAFGQGVGVSVKRGLCAVQYPALVGTGTF